MNHVKYTKTGIWIFVLIALLTFIQIYAVQSCCNWLFYVGAALILLLSFILYYFVTQGYKYGQVMSQEMEEIKRREEAGLQEQRKKQQKDTREEVVVFNIEEKLLKILPASDDHFDKITHYTEKVLKNTAKELDIVQGLVFALNDADQLFHVSGEYAYFSEELPRDFPIGETLSGQVAKNQQLINIQDMPDGYITILSGLGKGNPRHLIIAPIIYEEESIGVIELASFHPFGKNEEELIRRIASLMADKLNELRRIV